MAKSGTDEHQRTVAVRKCTNGPCTAAYLAILDRAFTAFVAFDDGRFELDALEFGHAQLDCLLTNFVW